MALLNSHLFFFREYNYYYKQRHEHEQRGENKRDTGKIKWSFGCRKVP